MGFVTLLVSPRWTLLRSVSFVGMLDFTSDVFASLTRAGWRERGECYLRGLMLDGKQKSIQPMAARLPDAHDQALNHFVTDNPWDPVPARERLAHKMDAAI